MAMGRSSSRVLKDYRTKANSADIEKEEVPRPKSGGTGDDYTRKRARAVAIRRRRRLVAATGVVIFVILARDIGRGAVPVKIATECRENGHKSG
jgi:hypothetical protein